MPDESATNKFRFKVRHVPVCNSCYVDRRVAYDDLEMYLW